MKKRLLTVLTVLLTTVTVVIAQSFELQYQGRSLENGAELAILAEENSFGELACETNPSDNPNNGLVLKLLDATSAEVSARIELGWSEMNISNIQWCMGGVCNPLKEGEIKTKEFTANEVEPVMLDVIGIQAEGSLRADISITVGEVTKMVRVKFYHFNKQAWWDAYNSNATWYVNGTRKAERYYLATHITRDLIVGEDVTIEGISIPFRSYMMKDVEFWVSKSLPEFGGKADLETVTMEGGTGNYQVGQFSGKHAIPEEGLYVGCSFTIEDASDYNSTYPINYMAYAEARKEGCLFATTSNPSWRSLPGELRARILSGGKFQDYGAIFDTQDLGSIYTIQGEENIINMNVKQTGMVPISSFKYVIEEDGRVIADGVCKSDLNSFMGTTEVGILIPSDGEAKMYNRTIRITEVNCQLNGTESTTTKMRQFNLIEKPEYMPLFEEFTGTWCGWCVRGLIAMERAAKEYSDKAALIAVHSGDPMAVEAYNPIIDKYCTGYPGGISNRKDDTGISLGTVTSYVSNSLGTISPAAIEATAQWEDQGQTAISVKTKTTFQTNLPDGNYAIAYILTADGLTGTDYGWRQSNYYSGGNESDPELQEWCNRPSSVEGVVYNHVAVAAWQPEYGVSGSVEKNIKAGETQEYNFTADISDNTIIQDKSKLRMITLLLDANTGEFINAAQTTISQFSGTEAPKGDLDGNNKVDANDVIMLVNYLCGQSGISKYKADVNGDGQVNVADIIALIALM